jgi:hypothetical protein
MLVSEHGGRIEHDNPAQVWKLVDDRHQFVDVFLILGDEHRGAAVAHLVGQLGSRRGRIDAVDDGAERLRRLVADHPFLASVAHDGDAIATGEAERLERARSTGDHRRVIMPGAFAIEAEVLGAQRNRGGLGAGQFIQ